MQLKNFACVCIRPQACVCVCPCVSTSICVRVSPHRKLNVRTRLDAKNFCVQTRLLFKDFRDVLYSNPDLWVLYNCNIFSISYLITTVLAYLENVTQCITDYSVKMTGMVLTSLDSSVVAMLQALPMAYQVTAKSLHTKFWGVETENKLTHVNYRCINISGHPQ